MPIITKQIEHIANKGPEAVSLQKVKEYLLKQYDQSSVTNDYWLYVIYNQLRHGVDFDKDYKHSCATSQLLTSSVLPATLSTVTAVLK